MAWRTQAEALAIVKRQCAAEVAPELDDTDINAILLETAHATVWTPSTQYGYDAHVVPTVRAGYVFTPRAPGQSGTTEPEWPTVQDGSGLWMYSWPHSAAFLTGLTDGTVEWVAQAPDFSDIWDTDLATSKCWELKAAMVDVIGGQDIVSAQVGDVKETYGSSSGGGIKAHCLQMADRYRPLQVA